MAAATTVPPLDAEQRTAVLDALPRLGLRSRRHSVSDDAPAPGRYLALEGEGETRLMPLEGAVTHIGRAFGADLVLDDPSVSRRHAIVVLRAQGARILDDCSANGTHVNGRRVTEQPLADGDVIVLGRLVLRYVEIAGG